MYFILLLTFSVNIINAEHICEQNPPGQYCTDDLSGYHDCIVDSNGGVVSNGVNTCGSQKRCSCFLKLKCTVPKEDICEPYVEANFVKNFWTTAHGDVVKNSPTGTTKETITVEIIQNAELGNLKKVIYEGVNQRFLYIIKSGDQFNKFEGGVFGGFPTCEKTVLNEFPAFGDDLKKFTQVTSNGIHEEWFFQTGRRNQGESLKKENWVTLKIRNSKGEQVLRPKSYNEEFFGGIAAKFNSKTTWKFGLFFNRKFAAAYFVLHPSCNGL